jgi:uncharacterized protein YchJ
MNIPGQSLMDQLRSVVDNHSPMTERQSIDVFRMMMDVNNHARCWVNNGYTPSELAQKHGYPASQPMHIKTGPNDPCPCGSGKKYKKCCMLK